MPGLQQRMSTTTFTESLDFVFVRASPITICDQKTALLCWASSVL